MSSTRGRGMARAGRGSKSAERTRPAKPSPAQTREDLAVELYAIIRLALKRFGVSPAQQRRAMARSKELSSVPYVSGPLLRGARGLGAILLEWSREAEYLDSHGHPRVLPIAGTGATFESLARRFLPEMPLQDVVSLACQTAEVARRPGSKIALIGSILVKIAKSRELYLAHGLRQIDQLLETMLYNRQKALKRFKVGRMERMAVGIISRAKFKVLMHELRPQIYDLLLGVDSSVQRHQPKSVRRLRGATAVSVGLYVSAEDDLERAGLDANLLAAPTIRAKGRGGTKVGAILSRNRARLPRVIATG